MVLILLVLTRSLQVSPGLDSPSSILECFDQHLLEIYLYFSFDVSAGWLVGISGELVPSFSL